MSGSQRKHLFASAETLSDGEGTVETLLSDDTGHVPPFPSSEKSSEIIVNIQRKEIMSMAMGPTSLRKDLLWAQDMPRKPVHNCLD